jgi:hypothetical protein
MYVISSFFSASYLQMTASGAKNLTGTGGNPSKNNRVRRKGVM